jgi:hypothetical protein
MNFISNVPQIRLVVDNSYCGVKESSLEEAYLVAVTSIASEPLYFTVHLASGALWQRLPIAALCTKSVVEPLENEQLQPYSCLGGDIQVIQYDHLKDYRVKVPSLNLEGTYLFTVDVAGPGLASDPIQHKTHNIIALDNGQLCAMPNNYLIFKDDYFTSNDAPTPKYSRVDKKYSSGT